MERYSREVTHANKVFCVKLISYTCRIDVMLIQVNFIRVEWNSQPYIHTCIHVHLHKANIPHSTTVYGRRTKTKSPHENRTTIRIQVSSFNFQLSSTKLNLERTIQLYITRRCAKISQKNARSDADLGMANSICEDNQHNPITIRDQTKDRQ